MFGKNVETKPFVGQIATLLGAGLGLRKGPSWATCVGARNCLIKLDSIANAVEKCCNCVNFSVVLMAANKQNDTI